MPVRILEVGPDQLPLYGTVPTAFRVEAILQVQEADGGLGGLLAGELRFEEGPPGGWAGFASFAGLAWLTRLRSGNRISTSNNTIATASGQ